MFLRSGNVDGQYKRFSSPVKKTKTKHITVFKKINIKALKNKHLKNINVRIWIFFI